MYKDVSHKIKMKCEKHGWFEQKPYQHYGGAGCMKCSNEEVHESQKIGFEEFVKRSIDIHGVKYVYDKNGYTDIFTPLVIRCAKHGEFTQTPRDHYRGSGCTKCLSSRGEREIRLILERCNVKFEEQKTFTDLKHKNKLRCDFFLPLLNTVIEYNGIQHYEPVSVFGGENGLIVNQFRDKLKAEFLSSQGIRLIVIRFDNENIEDTLRMQLGIK
jgi:very-short-patch-repair endonuclease